MKVSVRKHCESLCSGAFAKIYTEKTTSRTLLPEDRRSRSYHS
ncbi:hypothetical protein GCWU000342_01287 [Shuttleworthella satelles DSM 14600]|uniref:Uncharacterized protein n=1 Tax=Shuttleworthella satelles DSM 14600 TaxID=626523 RepID=C4GBI5_9FIRM|nr:hypothetical protein GCWU000342_01287 [Shuttleworthia satelles DSM 14600]